MKFNSLRTTTLVFHELFLPSVSILNTITESLKSGKGCDGFYKAIDPCCEILTRHFPRSADDSDELPNKFVTES
jgi:uncharacterized membrane protein